MSPHGRVTVDVTEARQAPGVVAAWTGEDIASWCSQTPRLADDEPVFPLVATDTVRYVGEAVAVVVARSAAAAQDAAERVEVEYDELPVAADAESAMAEGAPQLHPDVEHNVVLDKSRSSGDVEAAFAAADVVVRRRFEQPRVFPAAMEPRAVTAQPDAEGFTIWVSTQIPHVVQRLLAEGSGIAVDKLRVIATDVGVASAASSPTPRSSWCCSRLAS
ncbi:MAG: molybdopterin cofactor-binding domain-containing protein [Nocardioidaceae bacterium]